MILRCTAKARALLGGRSVALVEAPPGDDDWYLNVLWIDRRKWLLITHAGSRFSVLVADVRVAALRPPGPLVVGAIVAALRDEGLPASALGPLDPADVQIATTASRSVLGSMTDIAWRVEQLLPVGQTAPGVVLSIQRALQRTPTGSIGWSYPIEAARARAGSAPAPTDGGARTVGVTRGVRLRIDLTGIRPAIWRRLEVPVGASLADLAEALLWSFGWDNSHLHLFTPPGRDRQPVYVPGGQLEFMEGDEVEATTEAVAVGELLGSKGDELELHYDFGDGWVHRIRVEAELAESDARIRCTDGRRSGPPEDCGGVWGYESLLEAIADPAHEEHAAQLEWLGGSYDPEAFDVAAIDAVVAAIPVAGPRRR